MSERLAIVLAAGKGSRMNSDLPKVLHPVRGRPMIEYVLQSLEEGGVDGCVVVIGYGGDLVREALADYTSVEFAEQNVQHGTGHAVMMCREQLVAHDGPVVIVTGDSPLLRPASLRKLLEKFEIEKPACLLGTLHKEDPTGLGRIVRDENQAFVGIVEHKDATPEQLAVTEVNMSTYVFNSQDLILALDQLSNDNNQGEYYLTDCPGILRRMGRPVDALPVLEPCEALSINTLDDLARVEAEMQKLNEQA
ncbi:sugar phosphate nucleotidyltransferase [Lignipirellula cremea]|uniref:Bifunctional protein GlmU n=1 Tax=Lignipirellula cremea TaxID=2528010 RepID=A0A518DWW7_9BACT|nr:NTP transferase domain-containing protein [Lignipirellula cremea]QDU96327.1 Bifunctional protein GlmU [Lignipirellula cremea]